MASYSFEDLKVKLGGCFYLCSGEADYEIEDEGIGSYEFWGQKGNDSYKVAVFDGVSLTDWELIGDTPSDATGEPLQGLTEAEVKLLADRVAETLNDNSDLCSELAGKADDDEREEDS